MITQLRSACLRAVAREPRALDGQSAVTHGLGWLIQVALALYLIPALLLVLAVGGIGMLVLAVVRLLTWAVRGPRAPEGSQHRHQLPTP